MKRVLLVIIPLAFLLGFSTFAQKLNNFGPIPQPPPDKSLMVIQDDKSNSFIVFDQATGEYRFVQCGGSVVLTGLALIKVEADEVNLTHIQWDRQVVFSCNMASHQGKGVVEITESPKMGIRPECIYIIDSDMANNTDSCNERYEIK